MTAATTPRTRKVFRVVEQNTIIASPANTTVAAAVCPDGKLDVAGVVFKRTTSGRGRATTNVTDRNTVTSRTNASVRNAASRHRRRQPSSASQSAAVTITGNVLTPTVAAPVTSSNERVRRAANQRFSDSSQRPTELLNVCVNNRPTASIKTVSTA